MINHYIKPNWNAPDNVHAVSTLRIGGFSQGFYNSFNLADHVGDNPDHVSANRQKLRQELKLINEPLWLHQTHGNKAICADNALSLPEADASFTASKNIICAVLTADCLPILLCDKNGTKIAAIHAGWKGLFSGIIENTIESLKINPNNLLAWLGPAVGTKAFEVGSDVYEKFIGYNLIAKKAFQIKGKDKWLTDIYVLARQRLVACDIISTNIYGNEYCTYSNEQYFFSYRRDGEKTGRMASLIYLT